MINTSIYNAYSNYGYTDDYIKSLLDGAENDRTFFGWLPAYSTFIFIGIFVAVIACIIKFRLKKIPLAEFRTSLLIIIPTGIIFASFFGKLGSSQEFNWRIYEYFFFWNPGMNLFGGLVGGTVFGFIYFWFKRRKKLISIWVYADCIVPNILIAQSIGRWGNFFNHEIMGPRVINLSQIDWLPKFIWEKCFYVVNPETGVSITPDTFYFYQPLFLYESFGTFILFLLISFLIPNLGRLFSKKPWVDSPTTYPCFWNKKNKYQKKNELILVSTQVPIKYKKNKNNEFSLSLWNVWNKAYYLREVDFKISSDYQAEINLYHDLYDKYLLKKEAAIKKYKFEKNKLLNNTLKNKKEIKSEIKSLKFKYLDFKDVRFTNKFTYLWNCNSANLYNLHNEKKYFIVHCGMVASFYLLFYAPFRLFLETQRYFKYELSIKDLPILDYLSYVGLIIFGIVLFIFAQFIAPKKWREEGWLYEKSY